MGKDNPAQIPLCKQKLVNHSINKIGFWSGIVAFTATVAYCIVQLLQLYGLLTYPTDERLIYGTSLCIVIPFVLEILALHYITPESKQFWSHAALIFATLYAVFVTANYVVQLATVIPMTLNGTADEIQLLRQKPHSIFWDFDAAGYIFMGIATLFTLSSCTTFDDGCCTLSVGQGNGSKQPSAISPNRERAETRHKRAEATR